jgi:hypothetical protein
MPENNPTESDNSGRDAPGIMRRGGFYNRHSLPQHEAASYAEPLLRQAAEAVAAPPGGQPIVIADYGAAQGRNSLDPMRRAIGIIRRSVPDTVPISVVHTDIPADDFSALFTLIENSPDSYLREVANVFPFAAGRTFYKRIFPAASVSLGWSAIAVHWLSAAPAIIEGHVWSPRADPATLASFARRSARDWRDFLAHRAAELRPGARLVVIGGASDEAGDSAANGLMDMANAALRELVAAGCLGADEYRRMVIPTYNRTPAEFAAPFADGTASGLRLLHGQLDVLADPILARYQETGDLDAFAASCVGFFEAAFEPSLFSALAPGRSPDRRRSLETEFRDGLRARIAADPQAAGCNWRVYSMLIAKDA